MNLLIAIESQSPDIAQGVHVERNEEDTGAGDQVNKNETGYKIIIACFETNLGSYCNTVSSIKLLEYILELKILYWTKLD